VLVLVLAACTGLAITLTSSLRTRIDATATREHQLSPQALRVLQRLDIPVRIVIAADMAASSASDRLRLEDVLDKFSRTSERLEVRVLDTGSPAGLDEYDRLLRTLAEDEKPAIDRQRVGITSAISATTEVAEGIRSLMPTLSLLGDALIEHTGGAGSPGAEQIRARFNEQAAMYRLVASNLDAAVKKAGEIMARNLDPLPLPQLDQAGDALRPGLRDAITSLTRMNEEMDRIARGEIRELPESARTRARELADMVAPLRDRAARVPIDLDALGRLRILSIAQAIQRTRACLLIGPPATSVQDAQSRPTLTAVAMDELLPLADQPGAQDQDRRFRAEELLTAGLASLTGGPRPLVVFLHGYPLRLSPGFEELRRISGAIFLRGMEVSEWAIALDDQQPALISAARSAKRPIVWICFPFEARSADAAPRVAKLADAMAALAREGEAMMINLQPSTLPGTGADDPMSSFLREVGVDARTGTPIVRQTRSATGRWVDAASVLTDPGAEHPISQTLRSLRTRIAWAVPMRSVSPMPAGVRMEHVLRVPASAEVWGESEFGPLRQTPPERWPDFASPPTPNGLRDLAGDGAQGDWIIAAAVTRSSPTLTRDQRLLIVGGLDWLTDTQTLAGEVVEGRPIYAYPGNLELFIAGTTWLAGQDDLVARTGASASIATIPALTSVQRSALAWSLIAGVPVLVLLAGAAWRLARG
jgi:hypothetical protein